MQKFADNSEKHRIADELAKGSTRIGPRSGQAVVYVTPEGVVTRIGQSQDMIGARTPEQFNQGTGGAWPIVGAADIPEMVKSLRSYDFYDRRVPGALGQNGIRVEQMPLLSPIDDEFSRLLNHYNIAASRARGTPMIDELHGLNESLGMIEGINKGLARHLASQIAGRGPYVPFDVRPGNLSHVPGQPGRIVIHDTGAVGIKGGSALPPRSAGVPDIHALREAYRLNAPQAVRDAVLQAARPQAITQGVPYPGQLLLRNGGMIADPWNVRLAQEALVEDFIRRINEYHGGPPPSSIPGIRNLPPSPQVPSNVSSVRGLAGFSGLTTPNIRNRRLSNIPRVPGFSDLSDWGM